MNQLLTLKRYLNQIVNKEEWRDIPGYDGLYQVSNLGNVLSVRRKKMLKPAMSKGYKVVVLCDNAVRRTISIHKIVAMSFLNHKPCGMNKVVDHIDGNTLNNDVSNLQIISHRGNIQKANRKDKSSKFTGVSFHKRRQLYRAYININKVNIHLGFYDNDIDASKAYEDALKRVKIYE